MDFQTALSSITTPERRFRLLMLAHRYLKHQVAMLNLGKLAAIEQGHLDAWDCAYQEMMKNLTLVEATLEKDYLLPISLLL